MTRARGISRGMAGACAMACVLSGLTAVHAGQDYDAIDEQIQQLVKSISSDPASNCKDVPRLRSLVEQSARRPAPVPELRDVYRQAAASLLETVDMFAKECAELRSAPARPSAPSTPAAAGPARVAPRAGAPASASVKRETVEDVTSYTDYTVERFAQQITDTCAAEKAAHLKAHAGEGFIPFANATYASRIAKQTRPQVQARLAQLGTAADPTSAYEKCTLSARLGQLDGGQLPTGAVTVEPSRLTADEEKAEAAAAVQRKKDDERRRIEFLAEEKARAEEHAQIEARIEAERAAAKEKERAEALARAAVQILPPDVGDEASGLMDSKTRPGSAERKDLCEAYASRQTLYNARRSTYIEGCMQARVASVPIPVFIKPIDIAEFNGCAVLSAGPTTMWGTGQIETVVTLRNGCKTPQLVEAQGYVGSGASPTSSMSRPIWMHNNTASASFGCPAAHVLWPQEVALPTKSKGYLARDFDASMCLGSGEVLEWRVLQSLSATVYAIRTKRASCEFLTPDRKKTRTAFHSAFFTSFDCYDIPDRPDPNLSLAESLVRIEEQKKAAEEQKKKDEAAGKKTRTTLLTKEPPKKPEK